MSPAPGPVPLKNGEAVMIRPIRPDDEPLMVRFHEGLSERSVYQRFFHMMRLTHRISHDRLARVCAVDAPRDVALVAEWQDPQAARAEIVGVARVQALPGGHDGEFSVIVTDRFQGIGLGTALMARLIDTAREAGLTRIGSDVLSENADMQRMCARLGFTVRPTGDPQVVKAELDL